MKQKKVWKKQICKPKDYSAVANKCIEVGRRHFRKWKKEENKPLKQQLTFEFVIKKSGIPLINFNEVRDYEEYPD